MKRKKVRRGTSRSQDKNLELTKKLSEISKGRGRLLRRPKQRKHETGHSKKKNN